MKVIFEKPIKTLTNMYGKDIRFDEPNFMKRVEYRNNEVTMRPEYYFNEQSFRDVKLPYSTTQKKYVNVSDRLIPEYSQKVKPCLTQDTEYNSYVMDYAPYYPVKFSNVENDPRYLVKIDDRRSLMNYN